MKKLILSSLFVLFTFGTTFAQRIAYVDTEYILSKMPDYKLAQEELQNFTKDAYAEISKKEQEVISMRANFEKNSLLMPDNLKIQEEDKLKKSEQELLDLKNSLLGPNGKLFQQQQNLIQPLQNQIYNAIKKIAEQRDFDFILDKSTGVSILYVKPKFDMSEEVLKIVTTTQINN